MLTQDNWQEVTTDNIARRVIPDSEVKAILRLPKEVNKNITRIQNGTKGGNARILFNDVVYFMNNVNRAVAAAVLDFVTPEKNKPALNSVLSAAGILRYPMDLPLYNELKDIRKQEDRKDG